MVLSSPRFITGEKLVPGAREVLTEIFKSCAHSEQMLSLTPAKPIKVSDIYLSKEQINSQTPGNLLQLFFTNVRPPKKVLEDQLTQVAAHPAVLVLASAAPWADPEDPSVPVLPTDPEEVRRAETQVRQEQVRQRRKGAAPREGRVHQAAHHQAARQGQGCAQQCQVRTRGGPGGAPGAAASEASCEAFCASGSRPPAPLRGSVIWVPGFIH